MRIAICLHLFHPKHVVEISNYLDNIHEPYDLYVTVSPENVGLLRGLHGKFETIFVENVGYDIFPFIKFLESIDLYKYDIIIKLHTKRDVKNNVFLNGYNLKGNIWRDALIYPWLGTRKLTDSSLKHFRSNSDIGMIATKILISGKEEYMRDIDSFKVETTMKRLKLDTNQVEFVAGTIFAVRSVLLQPFKDAHFTASDFVENDSNSLAFCLERCFGFAVSAQGYKIKGIRIPLSMYLTKLLYAKIEGLIYICIQFSKRYIPSALYEFVKRTAKKWFAK